MIYLDNAATTRLCKEAIEAMQPYLDEEYYNANSAYTNGRLISRAIEEARNSLATLINADTNEIIFTSGGAEADSMSVLGAFLYAFGKTNGKHIITTKIEHHAVLNACKMAEKLGARVTYLDVDEGGLIDLEKLRSALSNDTFLVSIMMANNEIGTVQPIKEACKIVKEYNSDILFHTDSVQAFSNMHIDVNDLKIDLMSCSAHKFNGPKGMGFLYCRKGVNICPIIYGGDQESGRRGGTSNTAGIVGMAVAAKKCASSVDERRVKYSLLRNTMIEELGGKLDKTVINGDNALANILSISFLDISGERLVAMLEHDGVLCSRGAACDGNNMKFSHVLDAMGLDDNRKTGTIRLSFGVETTLDDIKKSASIIVDRVNMLRRFN